MIVGHKYVPSEIDAHYDAIVIGSGLGGLTTAALMAKAGRKVLVLERHYTAGGFTHSFRRRGYSWDVGVHYVGEVHQPGSSLRRVFDSITDAKLSWAPMDPVYDQIILGDSTYDFRAGAAPFREGLLEHFGNSRSEIDHYLSSIRSASRSVPMLLGQRQLPPLLAGLSQGPLTRATGGHFTRTTAEVMAGITSNRQLAGVLTGQWGDYGLPPARSSFGMHAVVAQHYLGGAAFPVGGASEIARTIAPVIERVGGRVVTQAEVAQVMVAHGRAIGVRMTCGDEIRAAQVISGVGVHNTYTRLLPQEAGERQRISHKLSRLTPAVAHVGLYVGLTGTTAELGLRQANQWKYRSANHDAEMARFLSATSTDFPLEYYSFPSAKDPAWESNHPGRSSIDVIAPAPYAWFEKWAQQPWGNRGDDYEAFKAEITDKLLEGLYQREPQVRGRVEHVELSTPLSTAHFSNYSRGELYGLEHTPERFAESWVKPRTPIKGLYLTGQDTLFCGVASALMSGVITAAHTLGPALAVVAPELLGVSRLPGAVQASKLTALATRPRRRTPTAKLAPPEAPARAFTARCVDVVPVTHDVVSLRFRDASGEVFSYKPGQFVTVEVEVDGQRHYRSYTMSSTPTRPNSFEITVKRVAGGAVSNWLCQAVAEGAEVPMNGPHGSFTCAPRPPAKALFLSAGSGVTPMLSMARWLDDVGAEVDVAFVHIAKTRADLIFADEVETWAKSQPQFTSHVSLTREGAADGWEGATGRLTSDLLTDAVPDLGDREVYACGPTEFMALAQAISRDAGVPASRYHAESFGSASDVSAAGGTVDFAASAIRAACSGQQSILEAAEASGLEIANACRTGSCGECVVSTLSGAVVMSNDEALAQHQIDEGLVLACVAYPDGDVVVDL